MSPYEGKPTADWKNITADLIEDHPLKRETLTEAVLTAWSNIFNSAIGEHSFKIGEHIFPKSQIMGFLLHELVPLELSAEFPNEWRGEKAAGDKDIEYIPNNQYSIEIKTSSNKSQIYGNRSYAQKPSAGKKVRMDIILLSTSRSSQNQ